MGGGIGVGHVVGGEDLKRGIGGGVGGGGEKCLGKGECTKGGDFVREAAGEHVGSPIGELLL